MVCWHYNKYPSQLKDIWMKKILTAPYQKSNPAGRSRFVQRVTWIWLGVTLTSVLVMLVGCNSTSSLTPASEAEGRQEALTLPTQAPTLAPTPANTRVLPVELLTPQPTVSITPIPDEVRGLVVDVIAGDTIAVVLDGDPASRAYEVRYLGVEAPENAADEPWGVVAYEANQELTKLKIVRLVRDETDFDDDGYLLRYVYIDDQLLSVLMAEEGLARAAVEEPNVRFASDIRAAEQRARAGRLGLWGPRGPTPTLAATGRSTAPADGQTGTPPVVRPTGTLTTTRTTEPVSTAGIRATVTVTGTAEVTPRATTESSADGESEGQ
jgi:micrococcal nuclease